MESTQKKILIISAIPKNARHLESFLNSAGYELLVVHTGQEGLDQIKIFQPNLILSEFLLPDIQGVKLTTSIRAQASTQNLPILLFSTDPIQHDEKIQAFKSGVDDFVTPPVKMDELLFRIQALLRRVQAAPKAEPPAPISPAIQTPTPEVEPPEPREEESSFRIEKDLFDDSEEEDEEPTDIPHMPLKFFTRLWEILHSPRTAMGQLHPHQDFFVSIALVIGTPIVASLSYLLQPTNSFDAWMGSLSLGLATSTMVWLGLGGLIQLVLPFRSVTISTKTALIIAGLANAPRFVGALCTAVYGLAFHPGIGKDTATFSAGLNVIPGVPATEWVSFISRIGIFDFWSAGLILTSLWIFGKMEKNKWNTISILVAIVALIFGAFSSY